MLKKQVWIAVLVALTVSAMALPAIADALSPISVSGFNRDVMFGPDGGVGGGYANNLAPTATSTWTMYSEGTIDKNNLTYPGTGLPIGNFTSQLDATHTYSFASAGGIDESDNALNLQWDATSTLTLATPGQYDSIGVLSTMAAGGGGGSAALVLHYSDGSTSSGLTYSSYDYYNGGIDSGNRAVKFSRCQGGINNGGSGGLDQCNIVNDQYLNAFWVYESVVPVDPTKTLVSIDFTGVHPAVPNGSNIAFTSVLAVSGAAVPEPASLALLAGGLLGLLAYVWRKRK